MTLDAGQKGERAAQIIDDAVYKEAVEGARQRIKDEWGTAKNADTRENLWHRLQAIDAVTVELRIIRDRGIIERDKRDKETQRG